MDAVLKLNQRGGDPLHPDCERRLLADSRHLSERVRLPGYREIRHCQRIAAVCERWPLLAATVCDAIEIAQDDHGNP